MSLFGIRRRQRPGLVWSWIVGLTGILILAGLAETLEAMPGHGGAAEERDTLKDILPVARDLATYEPKPEWQTLIRTDAADLIEFVSPDRVLVGTVEIGSRLARPSHSGIQLYDARTGKKLWEGRRPEVPGGSYTLLAADPAILLLGSSEERASFSALDPGSGRSLWTKDYRQPCVVVLDEKRGRLIAGPLGRAGIELSALSVGDGSPVWSRALPVASSWREGGAQPGTVPTARDDQRLYLAADELYAVSIDSGDVAWKIANPAEDAPTGLLSTDRGLILTAGARMWLVDGATGGLTWAIPDLGGSTVALSTPAGSGSAFVVTREGTDRARDIVRALSLADGKVAWTLAAKTLTQSALLYASGRLVFSTVNSLEFVDARTGRVLSSTPFPKEWDWGINEIPDVLEERADRVYLASEKKGVCAFALSGGKLLWRQPLDLFYGAPFWYLTKSSELSEAAGMAGLLHQKAVEDRQWWANWVRSVDYQWSGYNSSGSYDAQLKGQLGQTMVLFQSVLALSAGLQAAFEQEARTNLVLRKQMELDTAVDLQARGFQGKYWVRPFEKRGLAALIVDLDTGKRADLQFSAPNPGMSIYGVVLPCLRLAPDGKRMVAFAVGIDESKYEKYVKFGWGMPYPSLLSYKLSALGFTENVRDDASLAVAAERGDTRRMKTLLDGGAWPDSRTMLGNTPLEEAAKNGRDDAVRLLLSSGAAVNHRNEGAEVKSAVELAAFNGHSSTVKILLEAGADPGQAALWAGQRGHPEVLKILGGSGPLPVNSVEDALGHGGAGDVAAFIKDRREADRPLKKGTLVFAEGTTPLMLAASLGNLEAVRYLLDIGADINRMEKSAQKENALMKASGHGHTAVVRLLIEARASVNATDADGMTALYKAAEMGRLDAAKLLLDSGAAVGTRTKGSGDSALLAASRFGHAEMVKLLLERGAGVNERNADKTSALMEAAGQAHAAVVEVLLAAGADVMAKDGSGRTALDIARGALTKSKEDKERVIALLERTAGR
jgi:ankyrin repeat protein/outer membrane protein assembly factor BamB